MSEQNPFRPAIDSYQSGALRWITENLDDGRGGACLIGAVWGSCETGVELHLDDVVLLSEVCVEQYPQVADLYSPDEYIDRIVQANDHDFCGTADAVRVLEKAAVRWDERID